MDIREAFYNLLRKHEMTTIFGNPGSNELPLLKNFPSDFTYVLGLQEGVCVGMADGFAQATRRPSFVNLHAAAGTGNAMGNLTNTASGHVPMVITSGQQGRRYVPLNALLTNVDAIKLTEPLVKKSYEPLRPQEVPQALSMATLLATAAPSGPVYLSIPLDDWDQPADENAQRELERRSISGDPIVDSAGITELVERIDAAQRVALILGPDVDTTTGWDGAVEFAEKTGADVWLAPSPSRCPFPTRHPQFRGILPSAIPQVADVLREHDLAVAFGAAIFRYHEFIEGDYLPTGLDLWAVTSDPEEASRAPVGRVLVGDASDALARVARAVPHRASPPAAKRDPEPEIVSGAGPYTDTQIVDALNRAKTDDTVVVLEWTSVTGAWDRFVIEKPESLFFPASGGLGWGLPAALGFQLGNPDRRVLSVIGDGAMHYTVSALWTAVQYKIPVVFVVPRNEEYAALRRFTEAMSAPNIPGLDLPDLDIVEIATGYGMSARRVDTLEELIAAVRSGLVAAEPTLVEVGQQRLEPGSSAHVAS